MHLTSSETWEPWDRSSSITPETAEILTCLYENNYLAYLIEQLGQKLPFFVK